MAALLPGLLAADCIGPGSIEFEYLDPDLLCETMRAASSCESKTGDDCVRLACLANGAHCYQPGVWRAHPVDQAGIDAGRELCGDEWVFAYETCEETDTGLDRGYDAVAVCARER